MKLENLTVKAKLIIALAAVGGTFGAGLVYAEVELSHIGESVDQMYSVNLLSVDSLIEADRDAYQSSIAVSQWVNRLLTGDPSGAADARDDILSNLGQVGDRFAKAEKLWEQAGRAKGSQFETFHSNYEAFEAHTRQIVALLEAKDAAGALALYRGAYQTHFAAMRNAMDELTGVFLEGAKSKYAVSVEAAADIRTAIAVVIALSVLLSAFFLFMLIRNISRPISRMAEVAKSLAAGKLDHRLEARSNDEIGQLTQAFQQMIDAQRGMAEVVRRVSLGDLKCEVNERSDDDTLARSLQQMITANREMAELVSAIALGDLSHDVRPRSKEDELSHSLERMVASQRDMAARVGALAQGDLTQDVVVRSQRDTLAKSVRDMTARLRTVVAKVRQASDEVAAGSTEMRAGASNVAQGATEQAAAVEEISAAMVQMTSNIDHSAENARQTSSIADLAAEDANRGYEAVAELVGSIRSIASKIGVIREIARQTNILALNAAVEAAREGTAGKGFAIVADEVRRLAESTTAAAADINQLSATSVEAAELAGDLLNAILPNVQKTAELVRGIAHASNDMSSSASQIASALTELNGVVQQNAAATEEMAATSELLARQADEMRGQVSYFRVDRGAGFAGRAAPPRRSPSPAPRPSAVGARAGAPAF